MKQQLNEIRRMQQLAGIIKENTQFDEDKLKKYHEYLLNLGGGDLGGDYKDILSKAKQFDSVEEFIEDDINTLATDDKVQADKIRKWVKQNIKINDGSSLNPRTKTIVDNLLAKTEEAIRIKDTDTLQKIYNKALTVGGGSWDYFIDQLTDKGLASITPRGMLVWNFENPEEVDNF